MWVQQPTLNEYIKHNKLEVNVGASREEVVDAVSKHFISMVSGSLADNSWFDCCGRTGEASRGWTSVLISAVHLDSFDS